MIQFSLGWLHRRYGEGDAPDSLMDWYLRFERDHPERLAPLLVEPINEEKIPVYYTLEAHPTDADTAVMRVSQVTDDAKKGLTFNQASGPRSPAIGPVIKRTRTKEKIAPTTVTVNSTLRSFHSIADAQQPWSPFFAQAHEVWSRSKLEFDGITHEAESAYAQAVSLIPDKGTVMLAYRDGQGNLPGQVPEYALYLQDILADTKYATNTSPGVPDTDCSLTGVRGVCYANGLAGARINLMNADREGAFPGVDRDLAHHRFAVCRPACDLLYMFRFHLLPDLLTYVGGAKALVLPSFTTPQSARGFQRAFATYVQDLATGEVTQEDRLRDLYLEDEHAVSGLHFVWATFGQKMEDVTFVLPDVLPSRMSALRAAWDATRDQPSAFSPKHPVDAFQVDAWMNALYRLFKRPGGKAAKDANGDRLQTFVRRMLLHLYRGNPLADQAPLLEEALDVARYYFREIVVDGHEYGLLREGISKKGESFPTLAGWTRALHDFLRFLNQLGLMTMSNDPPATDMEALQPYFQPDSGLDHPDKAYAFVLGVLFGRLLQLQGIRGVNAAANALPMVKNYQVHPRDIPALHVRLTAKLEQYHRDPNARISGPHHQLYESLLRELGRQSNQGRASTLTQTEFNFFLLLGQAITDDIFVYPKKTKPPATMEEST